jgi:hypothetical protein
MRALGYCLRGCRAFYAAHGLDWRRCLREGTPGEQLAATGDAMALKVLDLARREAGR